MAKMVRSVTPTVLWNVKKKKRDALEIWMLICAENRIHASLRRTVAQDIVLWNVTIGTSCALVKRTAQRKAKGLLLTV